MVDLVNRDPNELNAHVKADFENVLGEPDGIRSMDCVWKLSYTLFNCCQSLCYKLATLLCGLCIACELGCEFAHTAFLHVWFITPLMKHFEINCSPLRKINWLCADCFCGPCCEACALFLSRISIKKS